VLGFFSVSFAITLCCASQLKTGMNMKKKELFGVFITIIWTGLFILLAYLNIEETKEFSLSDVSNYIAGVAGGLALLWIILGYFQQGEELSQNTQALISQKQIMSQQIEENNKITISNSYQQLTSTYNNFVMNIASNERLARVWEQGKNNLEHLNDIDLESYYLLCVVYLGHHENLFILKEYGSLPDDLYTGWNNNLQANMGTNGFKTYWGFEGEHYYPKFKDSVDLIISHSKKNSIRHSFKDYRESKEL
jgi:hypothetical protein